MTAPTRPALRYYGGKWNLAPWIISHFPPHKNYVEPCGGAASVLLQKPRSPLETYNDLDGNVVNFFRVLRDSPDELIRQIRLTPWSRAEFEQARDPGQGSDLERARRLFVSAWMSISSMPHDKTTGWRSVSFWGQSYNLAPHNYFDLVDDGILSHLAARFHGVQIECRPYEYIVERYDGPETLTFFDPPYVTETRTNGNMYRFEWSNEDHARAGSILRACKGAVIVAGYACPLYAELYEAHGWMRHDLKAQGNAGSIRTESVWLSPSIADRKHQPALFGGTS